ncbi:unnamed protein product [Rotaria sordida]|uniref:Uncharacterized protein n=1 Tax=Rotaria sordida TaxID=392033 RepID=A0A815UPW7_9BILA|nr:unnamed protein product [Rotaria sordida]CAF4164199.1 unnamed protein product [Rotaria sordida]
MADGCDNSVIYMPALPQKILTSDKSASSFITVAPYGTGKTLLRCEYFKTLNADHYLKVLILNKEITDYIERFIASKKWNSQYCANHSCLKDWSGDEFAQLMLSILVTKFIENYSQTEIKFIDIPIEKKIHLVTIICYYYNGDSISQLENFVNGFLGKFVNTFFGTTYTASSYKASKAHVQISERNKPLLTHLQNDLNEFGTLNKNVGKLHLLLAIIEGEGFEYESIQKTMLGHVIRDLTDFSSFITKHMEKIPVFIIDGIDENQYLNPNNEVNKISFESFYRSSVCEKILSLTMTNYFYLSLFYPKIDGINILDAIVRPDKFPTYTLTWNSKSLYNYADYVLQKLNKNASRTRCKAFTDFKTLVNYEDQRIAEIIDEIQTPRELHMFMMELITQMNHDASNVERLFPATEKNVRNAFEKSLGLYYKYDEANG